VGVSVCMHSTLCVGAACANVPPRQAHMHAQLKSVRRHIWTWRGLSVVLVFYLESCVGKAIMVWIKVTRQQQQSAVWLWLCGSNQFRVSFVSDISSIGCQTSGGRPVVQLSHLSCGRPSLCWRLNTLIGAAAARCTADTAAARCR
jgi:hypothetical protein